MAYFWPAEFCFVRHKITSFVDHILPDLIPVEPSAKIKHQISQIGISYEHRNPAEVENIKKTINLERSPLRASNRHQRQQYQQKGSERGRSLT